MIINLADPFWSTLIGGMLVFIVSTGIIGIIKFTIITHQKKLIEDSFFRLRAELETIQKEYQKEITQNNEKITTVTKDNEAKQKLLNEIKTDIDRVLNHNKPPVTKSQTLLEMLRGK